MPIPQIEPVGAVAAAASTPGVINLNISGIKLNCLTCGDGGLVIATHAGWVISCRNGHNYEPIAGLMITISSGENE